ncbi:unnamed protein product [Meloidogyne enterolobii]|uniref:Uncharacterized protein n=1 Tax=Meloidogyne enterolobii TaxID=390850 RepID=A0ACB1AM74_MELEN
MFLRIYVLLEIQLLFVSFLEYKQLKYKKSEKNFVAFCGFTSLVDRHFFIENLF